MKRATVSAGLTRAFLDFAEFRGADRQSLLNQCALTDDQLLDQDARIAFNAYIQLIRAAKSALNDPALPLHYAVNTQIDRITVVGLIVHSSASMPDAMNQLNRYAKLMIELDLMEQGERFSITHDADEVWIVDNRPDPNATPEVTETAFGRFIGEFRRAFPEQPFALQINVTHPAPDHAKAYQQILNCPVNFDSSSNALQIAPFWLSKTFDNSSRYVFGIFTEKADALLANLAKNESLRAQVETQILADMHKGRFSIDDTASKLGMSRATLYRRLKDENTTFATLVDDLRCRMASDYLSARKVSVNETAYLVGFSESSSFVRAFRRWTGQTPSEFREIQPNALTN